MMKLLLLVLVLVVLAFHGLLYWMPSGLGVQVLDSETSFDTQLWNTFHAIGQAKEEWVIQNNKPVTEIPKMSDLTPYLGKWTNSIRRMEGLGLSYSLCAVEGFACDIVTYTRDIYFRLGFCRFYPAGCQRSSVSGNRPAVYSKPLVVITREFLIANRTLFEVVSGGIFLSGLGAFLFVRNRER